jgi:hypothetical protein
MASIDLDMNDKQLQPRPARNYSITQPVRQRGLVAQIWMALLQPGQFFRALPALDQTRQWLWVGLLILTLIGLSAVRQMAAPGADSNAFLPPADINQPDSNIFGGSDFGIPDAGIPPGGLPTSSTNNVSTTWTTALVAASGMVLGWFIQTVLLCEVSLLRGFSPRLGRNIQIAIWASLPLGVMAVLQLLYYTAGGSISGAGISGLVVDLPGYRDLSPHIQAIVLSFATQLTFFWLWSLALIYIGARRALQGRRWSSLLVVIAWTIILVVVPVLTGAVSIPEAESETLDLESLGLPQEALDILPREFLENMMDPGATVSETIESAVGDAVTTPIEDVQESAEGVDGASKNE